MEAKQYKVQKDGLVNYKGKKYSVDPKLIGETVTITELLTNAILDHLLRHSHVISIKGPSYRTKGLNLEIEEKTKR